MTLTELEIITKTAIRTERNIDGEFTVHFGRSEIVGDGVLIGFCGRGTTYIKAKKDLCSQMQGKKIAINAWTPQRKEFQLPEKISWR